MSKYSYTIVQRDNGTFRIEKASKFLITEDFKTPFICPYGIEESNYDGDKKFHLSIVVDSCISELKEKESALLKAIEESKEFNEKYDIKNMDYKPLIRERDGKCFVRVGFGKYTTLTKINGTKISKLKPENIKADSKIYGEWSIGVYCFRGSYGFFLSTKEATVKLGNKEPEKKRSIVELIHEQLGCKRVRIQEYKETE